MAFGLQKLAVLESKLDIYEDLSKEMLDKLERAVATISENSNRVAIILERHENRLNESDKNDAAILKLVEKVEQKIDEVEKRVNDISRFRWISVGIGTAAVVIIKSADLFGSVLTLPSNSATIPGATSALTR
jgi:septation ring formation regulator EzrA